MFRIAFLVTRSDQIGGSHIHVRDLAVALQNDGHDVRVFIGGDGTVIDHFKGFGLSVISIPSMRREISPLKDIKAYRELKEEIVTFSPDIITAHSSKAGYLGRIIAWNLGIPVMFTAHGWSFTDGKNKLEQSVYRWLEKLVVPITDKIIAVSDYDRKLGIEQLSLSDDKITTIHNGMTDIDESLIANPEEDSPVNIIMVARFDHQKDQLELLKATYNIENIHIHFVGDGHLRKDAEALAEKLEMKEKTTFWGELNSVDDVLAKSQIFALISNWEGFPCSTLEAMRAKLPTVVSDVGGSAEAIEQGVTGYAVKKGDIQTLHNVIKELTVDTEKRKEMGEAARNRFENLYTFETMYEKTFQLYSEIIHGNSNKRNASL